MSGVSPANDRRLFKGVEWRRRGDDPFQRVRACAPRVGQGFLARCHSIGRHDEEEYKRCAGNIRTVAGDQVPSGKHVGVIDVAARHTRETQEVLWEKR